ncbi:MAG: ABC transporter permease subunit [bacterium]|nr:ABC transporter permease subunit [bacterium]
MKTVAAWFNQQGIYWLVPLGILVVWQALVVFGVIPQRILPAPTSVLQTAYTLFTERGLAEDIAVSTARALTGLLIGGGIGFVLGMLNGLFPVSEKLLDTTIQMIRTIPHLALVPLVILWFGIDEKARIFLIALGVFFPMYVNTFMGIRYVDKGLIEMGRVYRLSTPSLFWNIILPGALPSILLGVRLALGVMWLTLIVAETIAANAGLGFLASQAREFMRTDVIVFIIVTYALLGKLADVIARLLERTLLRWHPNYQKAR